MAEKLPGHIGKKKYSITCHNLHTQKHTQKPLLTMKFEVTALVPGFSSIKLAVDERWKEGNVSFQDTLKTFCL